MAFDLSDLRSTVRSSAHVTLHGARTKSNITPDGAIALDLTRLNGVIDYQPTEFVITVWAGTPIAEVAGLLDERGQYLPFDPMLVERGATVGGTIASNACGPGRYRYGGARDFIIGVRFIDGVGDLIRGGGKVVKNAAGFDYPKLMVGSLGQLGVLVEVTFKVFPRPEAYATLQVDCHTLGVALALLPRLTSCPYDIDAIDLVATADGSAPTRLLIRAGGLSDGLPQRMDRVRSICGHGDVLSGEAERSVWREARELGWAAADKPVVKVPLTLRRIPELDACLGPARRRYSIGGNLAWISLAGPRLPELDAALRGLSLAGLVMTRAPGDPRIGLRTNDEFTRRVKRALDPNGRFSTPAR
jgi:glycolate oxidase FAD binding subunit